MGLLEGIASVSTVSSRCILRCCRSSGTLSHRSNKLLHRVDVKISLPLSNQVKNVILDVFVSSERFIFLAGEVPELGLAEAESSYAP